MLGARQIVSALTTNAEHKKNKKKRELTLKYWKPWSQFWNISGIVIILLALVENISVPSQEDVNNKPYQIFLIVYFLYLSFTTVWGWIFRQGHLRAYSGHFAQLNVSLGILLIVQDLLTEKFSILAQPFFVSFAQIIEQITTDHKLLWDSTVSSTVLWLVSFIVGALIGVVFGLLMGRYRQFNYWAFPYLKVIGIIPAAAWMPLTLVIFPTSYMSEIFLIAFAVWFPVAFMTIGGVQGISSEYFESAKTLGFSEWRIMWKIVIPGSLPSMFIGIFTALGLSFTMLVISEMMGAKVGLGWYINWARGVGNYTQVYAAIVIMAVLFSLIFVISNKFQTYFLRWREQNNH